MILLYTHYEWITVVLAFRCLIRVLIKLAKSIRKRVHHHLETQLLTRSHYNIPMRYRYIWLIFIDAIMTYVVTSNS